MKMLVKTPKGHILDAMQCCLTSAGHFSQRSWKLRPEIPLMRRMSLPMAMEHAKKMVNGEPESQQSETYDGSPNPASRSTPRLNGKVKAPLIQLADSFIVVFSTHMNIKLKSCKSLRCTHAECKVLIDPLLMFKRVLTSLLNPM